GRSRLRAGERGACEQPERNQRAKAREPPRPGDEPACLGLFSSAERLTDCTHHRNRKAEPEEVLRRSDDESDEALAAEPAGAEELSAGDRYREREQLWREVAGGAPDSPA